MQKVCGPSDLGIGWGVRERGRNRQCDRRADWSGLGPIEGPASVRGDGDESGVGAARGASVGVGCAGGSAATSTSPWAVPGGWATAASFAPATLSSTRAVTTTSEPGPAPRLTVGGKPAVGGGLRHPGGVQRLLGRPAPPGPAISLKSTARRHTCSARIAGSPNAARSHGSATLRFGGERLLLCPYAGGGPYQIRPAGDGSDR
jgi:hypothetical protein